EEYAMCVLVAAWTGVRDDRLAARLDELRGAPPEAFLPSRLEPLTLLLAMYTGPPHGMGVPTELRRRTDALELSAWSAARAGCGYGFMLQIEGEADQARAEFERSLASFRQMGERWGTVLALAALADLASEQEDHATAMAMADSAQHVARELGAREDDTVVLVRRA